MPRKSLRKVELKKKVDSKIRLYTNGDESCCNGDLGCCNKRFGGKLIYSIIIISKQKEVRGCEI